MREPRKLNSGKLPHDDFKQFDYIFIEMNYPEFFNYYYLNYDFREALRSVQDRIVTCAVDPLAFAKILKMKDVRYLEKRLHNKFWSPNFKDDKDITNWADFNKAVIDRRFLIPTFFPHEEVMQDGIYTISFSHFFKKLGDIPFEEKSPDIVTIVASVFRSMKKKHLKSFGLEEKDVKRLGSYRVGKNGEEDREVLSENEVQQAYSRHRFAFSPTYGHDAYTWFRARFLYCAMHRCVMLGTDPEIKFYGEPYQLDKSIFEKSLKEQKEIGEAQSEHFFKNLMSKDQAIAHLERALKA